ncbi:MAG: glycosyltransferase family 2 protein [Ilumatobacteraceae bacterium]
MSDKPLVLIPALNEEATIREVVLEVMDHGFDVVVINDGSGDKTAEFARAAGATVLNLRVNLGVGGALRCGFRYAVNNGYRSVVQCDADGQHPISHIQKLIDVSNQTSSHLVIGSRFRYEEILMTVPRHRRFAMWLLGVIASRACQTKITDSTSGFRLISEPLLSQFAKNFPSHFLGDTFEANVVAGRSGYKVKEVAAPISNRKAGVSSTGSGRSIILIARSILVVLFNLHFNIAQLADQMASVDIN